ncbi:MAG: tetratricopeptide repeat protein [Anaerolineales bacterium]
MYDLVAEWQARGRVVEHGGIPLFRVIEGQGPDLVCFHGFPSNSYDWHRLLPLLSQQRRVLGLTQKELAYQVGCSAITLRKLEAEDRKPSRQIADRLAEVLLIPPSERAAFLRFARGDSFAMPPAAPPAGAAIPLPPAGPRHNLPAPLTSFIGREREQPQVRQLFSAGRLVTLTGPGGSGKTRLALQAAGGLLADFPDGVWLVELAPLAHPALVAAALAAVLGLRDIPGRSMTTVVIDHVRHWRALLVLDNCEHLIAACAELAEQLLRACPHLAVLATSREALGIAGESAFQVPPLSLPDPGPVQSLEVVAQSEAVRLFVERARAAAPGFGLTGDNAAALVAICRRLDGIPLALELAAARMRLLSVAQLDARLVDRFRLLTGGSRTALPQHQTLKAMMDWSYDLLPAAEQSLLQRLAVFAGGWTLEAAEAVGAGDPVGEADVLDLLAHLVDKSLVQVSPNAGGAARYHLLETTRQYALDKLMASGQAAATQQRHAAHFVELAELGLEQDRRLRRPTDAWYGSIKVEADNLRAALACLQATAGQRDPELRLVWAMSEGFVGYWDEAQGWQEGALARWAAEGGHPSWDAARAQAQLGHRLALHGQFGAGQAWLLSSLALFQQLDDRPAIASVLNDLGWLARESDDPVTARAHLEGSRAVFRELGDATGLAGTSLNLAGVAVMQGDADEATQLAEQALAVYRGLGDIERVAWAFCHLGHCAQLNHEHQRARRLHGEALELFRSRNEQYGEAEVNLALGETELDAGCAAPSVRHFGEALRFSHTYGLSVLLAWAMAGMAGVASLMDEPERAACLWGAAEGMRQAIGLREAPVSHATHHRLMAAARGQLGDAAFAQAYAAGQAMAVERVVELALQLEASG